MKLIIFLIFNFTIFFSEINCELEDSNEPAWHCKDQMNNQLPILKNFADYQCANCFFFMSGFDIWKDARFFQNYTLSDITDQKFNNDSYVCPYGIYNVSSEDCIKFEYDKFNRQNSSQDFILSQFNSDFHKVSLYHFITDLKR